MPAFFDKITKDQPMTDAEASIRLLYCEQLIQELELKKNGLVREEEEEDVMKIIRQFKQNLREVNDEFTKNETNITKESSLHAWKIVHESNMLMYTEMDKNVLDVVLAVHHRLGRVDHSKHKKAYRRILYALIVQGLCRLMEPKAICIFREGDLEIGKSVIAKAEQKYKMITGLQVKVVASEKKFLPIESCGGVDIKSVNGKLLVGNSLSVRLDHLLHKAHPMIRIALFGRNRARLYYDLSVMSGSPTLFLWPPIPFSPTLATSSKIVVVPSVEGLAVQSKKSTSSMTSAISDFITQEKSERSSGEYSNIWSVNTTNLVSLKRSVLSI